MTGRRIYATIVCPSGIIFVRLERWSEPVTKDFW